MKDKLKKLSIPVLTIVLWSVFFYLILISHFEYSPVHLSKSVSKEIFLATPQGWSFFTKNPRYERLGVYRMKKNGQIEQLTKPNFSLENQYGFNRQNRQFLSEVLSSLKSTLLKDSIWHFSSKGALEASKEISSIYNFNSSFKDPMLCGRYILEMHKPRPWAWLSNKKYKNPKKYLMINLDCE
ncbi:SdpA family antimicrobial peptide system protein [Maribacter sp. 2-571]|uniref:SdpA family antimicrobial peptide system protein n=1 Tax=Maribacter sp. 2-571 TaxID=3417569 RepID=UPI003D344F48